MRTMLGRRVDRRRIEGQSGPGRKRMPNDATSPYATYLSHLQKGELAYQFSPGGESRGVLSARALPLFGQRQARMARQQRPRHGLLDHHRSSGRRCAVQRRADRCRGGLPADEPRRGGHAGCREDRHAGEIPRAQAGRRKRPDPRVYAGGSRDGRLEARRSRDRGRCRERSWPGGRWHEPDGPCGAGHAARARRLRADAEGRRRAVLRDDAGAHVDRADDRVSRYCSRSSSARR